MGQHRRLSGKDPRRFTVPAVRVGLLVLALILLAPGPATALSLSHTTSAEFTVPASNGYTLNVKSEDGQLTVLAFRSQAPVAHISDAGQLLPAGDGDYSAAKYYAPAAGGPEAIDAGLGALGEVDVAFQPSGQTRVTHLDLSGKRKGCNAPRRIVRRLGTFSGRISFQGENGYTAVDVTNALGSVGTSPYRTCSTKPGSPEHKFIFVRAGPDAFINTSDPAAHISFNASTLGPGAGFYANLAQVLPGGLAVIRTAEATARGEAFGLDAGRHVATLQPPPPFSGTATFRGFGTSPSWRGSLAVSFPGLTVPLTGPSFKADLSLAE